MSGKDIKDIIDLLPVLVIYVVPGYIMISVHNFLFSIKEEKNTNLLLKCLALSYILINSEKAILHLLRHFFGNRFGVYNIDSVKTILITIITGFLLTYLFGRLILSQSFIRILKWFGINKFIRKNIFDNLVDLSLGNWIRVYLPSEELIYTGKLRLYEDQSEDKDYFIVLSNYSLHSYDGIQIENNSKNNGKWVSLNMKNISRTEIIYSEKSRKIS